VWFVTEVRTRAGGATRRGRRRPPGRRPGDAAGAPPDPDLERFYALLRDYPARGGKRLRGRFVLAACAAHGGDPARALAPAAALELFQNWVLVHDDIEDDSEERRAPALHRTVGVPVALNVGDAMHVYMWQALLALRGDAGFDADAIRDEFVRVIHRTAEGQHLDLAWVAEGRSRSARPTTCRW
jgi:geranylgeranyl diphosphate synthase, type II